MFRSMSGFKAQYQNLMLLVISEFTNGGCLSMHRVQRFTARTNSARRRQRSVRWQ
jgi:hypothetical protein